MSFPSLHSLIALSALLLAQSLGAQAPANVVARETSPGVITITWSAVPGATQYHVGRSVWPEGFRRAGVVNDTIYVDSAVKAGVKHIYNVNVAGKPQRGRSNEVIPATNGEALLANATPGRVPINRGSVEPPPDSLMTPSPDTISAARCAAEANRQAEQRRMPRRVGKDSVAMPDEQPQAAEKTPVQRAYVEGKCRSPGSPGYPALWYPVAEKSGLAYEEQVRAWKEINIVGLAYKHILQREPTPDEARAAVKSLQSGKPWRTLWRELAHSPERDQRFGYWAPAPIGSAADARTAFGLSFLPKAEICFGGLGPGCNGTVPDSRVEPRWFGHFRLPDGTEMAYISLGAAVGSIVHDNACLVDRTGLNCDGLGAGDLVKTAEWPASLEWNKASWNVLDGRVWREVFGPYPTSKYGQSQFYDDLRPMPARTSYMAPILGMATIPVATVPYKGKETKQSRALRAPAGTSLDVVDAEFCRSGAFREKRKMPGKSDFGICR